MSVQAPEQAEPAVDLAGAPPGHPAHSRRPLVAGGFVGLWALVVGVAVATALVMLSWTLAPNAAGDSAAAWRASGLTWLAAHHVPLTISGQPLSLLPLGALLLPLLLTRRGGAWTGRLLPAPTPTEMAQIVGAAGLAYAAGGAGVAWLSSAADGSASLVPASLVTGLVAMLGTTWGVAREGDLVGRLRARLPESGWRTLTGGLAAVAGLVAAGAVLTAISLVASFGVVVTSLAEFDAGPAGAAGITLLSALSLPNLALWLASMAAGPGFQIGATGSMSAFGGDLGTLPAFPVLAVLPTSSPAWAPALLVLPVLAGGLASRIRWGADLPTAGGALVSALGLAAVVAPLTAALMWLSGGALGSGQLSWVGPLVLPVTAATVGLVCAGFLGEAGAQGLRLAWTLHRGEQARRAGATAGMSGAGAEGPLDPDDALDLDEDGQTE